MKAVILAAGKGIRFKPFSLTKPKPMIPIGGKPLLEWILIRLREAGVNEVLIVTHYLEDLIREYFRDGEKLGIKIEYSRQEALKGTADAFALMEPFSHDEEFIGLYGDCYLSERTIETVMRNHEEGSATLTILEMDDPSNYGVVKLRGDVVTGIVEKPGIGESASHYANVGLYIFPPEIFRWIRDTKPSKRGEYEITDSIELMVKNDSTVRAVKITDDMWIDVGLPWNLLDANMRALTSMKSVVEGEVEEGAHLSGMVKVERGSRIRSGAYIEGPVFIGKDCDIGPNCYIRPHTSIGAKVRIGNACEIKNSIIMDGTNISHLSYIGDSVIGERCNLGAGTITANLRFDKKTVKVEIEGRILDSKKGKLGAFIGDEAQTGVNVSIMPGVKIGYKSWIAPGVTVYGSVPENTFLKTS
ncbi:NTP transferase domain-containing protein [Candidatus Bathyarchaeota archaeon]|nr:NTP transferase domain-containing protein [Candidatus Bathyarchaeota archaeon]